MKSWHILASLLLVAGALTACGGAEATETDEAAAIDYESGALDTSYEGALDAENQLALGTLQLEETEHAVTSEQAKTLLPLWQALQGGVTAEGEISAVLKGIEGAMTEEQLAAIADMQLTEEDTQAWMEEQGLGARGGFPGSGDMSEEELETARATRQARFGGEGLAPGGEMPSGEDMPPEMATRVAEFQSMSEEEWEEMMATARAGGDGIPGGRAGTPGGAGRVGLFIRPLIEMLTERAG
jgi:hypothetical protein